MSYADNLVYNDIDNRTPEHDKIMMWLNDNVEKVIRATCKDIKKFRITGKRWELAVTKIQYKEQRTTVGFIDLSARLEIPDSEGYVETKAVRFEVKSTINSLGDLIRQIQFYKQWLADEVYYDATHAFIVVSPDDRYQRILVEQGILFYKYQERKK